MSFDRKKTPSKPQLSTAQTWKRMLETKVYRNERVDLVSEETHGIVIQVPNQKAPYMVPPITWILQPQSHRKLLLDTLGSEIYLQCKNETTVESIVEKFRIRHNLTFHEARVSVSQYIRLLVERSVLVLSVPQEI